MRSSSISGPRIYAGDASGRDTVNIEKRLTSAWISLVERLTLEPAPTEHLDGRSMPPSVIGNKNQTWGGENNNYGCYPFWIDRASREAINDLDLCIRLGFQLCYAMGKREGANILAQLNEGAVSTAGYEERYAELTIEIEQIKKRAREESSIPPQ
jgi:hypothetical protein